MDKTRRLGQRHKLPLVDHKVFVAPPAYDGKVHTDFSVSLAESCMHATHEKIGVQASVMGNGAFIELARNIFVAEFLKTDCTHLFFIDADLKWESRAFVGLVQSGRPVSAGAYRKRQEPEQYPVHYIEDTDDPGISIIEGGWIGCDRVATGFLCIQRHVIVEMVKHVKHLKIAGQPQPIPWIFYTQVYETEKGNETYMGEDFSWCDDYKKIFKEPIYVWPDFDFSHDGYKCNWHEFMLKQVETAEKTGEPINLIEGNDEQQVCNG